MNVGYQTKLDKLKQILRDTGGCAIAYSGGVDSTLLLTVAHEVLGDRCLAVTATSPTYPRSEHQAAVEFVVERGIPHVTIESNELDVPGFRENPPDRCYFCKKELFSEIRKQALLHGLDHVADGTNADDVADHRPGIRAADELKVLSPLKQARLSKQEVRKISKEVYHLPTADKPAAACLASRFPYGSIITERKLRQVEAIEKFLIDQGFSPCRARHHGSVVRLELAPGQIRQLLDEGTRGACIAIAKEQGFIYVCLDLEGFRSGSMNEVLSPDTGGFPHL